MTTNYSIDENLVKTVLLKHPVINDGTNTVRYSRLDADVGFRTIKIEEGHYVQDEISLGRNSYKVANIWFENEATQKAYLTALADIEEENKLLDKIFGKA